MPADSYPSDHCLNCRKRMRCDSIDLNAPWYSMRNVCDECESEIVVILAIHGGTIAHCLTATAHPWRERVRIQAAWTWFCVRRAAWELANIWRMRKPFDWGE